SSQPLKISFQGTNQKVYTSTKDNFNKPLAYYYLEENNIAPSMSIKAQPSGRSSGENFGAVVAFASKGDELHLGKTLENNLCYFGLPKSQFWTPFTEELFSDCVDFVITPQQETNETETNSTCSENQNCESQTIFSSLSTAETENSITVFFHISNSTNLTELKISLNNSNLTDLHLNSTNFTFSNLSSGTEYIITFLALPVNETLSINATTLETPENPETSNQEGSSSGNGGGGGGSICTTQWTCTEWSECIEGTQTRVCSSPENYCKPKTQKPQETQTCIQDLSFNSNQENQDLAEQNSETSETINENSNSKITGAVIGTLKQQPATWIIGFLLVVVALYIFVSSKK
ncbi:MAG: hypothetical protein KC506_02760, partial [Nanoarchaeota archaeon]|nr:hypothetical protein [Nanoarchaeota archaeon]